MDRNSNMTREPTEAIMSLSARRAWIEIVPFAVIRPAIDVSLSARRAWIEILYYGDDLTYSESLSARRAWIEMGGVGLG